MHTRFNTRIYQRATTPIKNHGVITCRLHAHLPLILKVLYFEVLLKSGQQLLRIFMDKNYRTDGQTKRQLHAAPSGRIKTSLSIITGTAHSFITLIG